MIWHAPTYSWHQNPCLNTQSCIRRPLCSTFKFENLRSPINIRFFHVFGGKKIKNKFYKKRYDATFSANAMVFSKKIATENMKKVPSKVAHNQPPSPPTPQFFFQYWSGCLNGQKNRNPVPSKPLNAKLGI